MPDKESQTLKVLCKSTPVHTFKYNVSPTFNILLNMFIPHFQFPNYGHYHDTPHVNTNKNKFDAIIV